MVHLIQKLLGDSLILMDLIVQSIKTLENVKLSYTLDDITANKPSTPGWSTRTVLDVDYDNNKLIISNSTGSNDSTSLSLIDNYNTLTYMDSEQSNFIPSNLHLL